MNQLRGGDIGEWLSCHLEKENMHANGYKGISYSILLVYRMITLIKRHGILCRRKTHHRL